MSFAPPDDLEAALALRATEAASTSLTVASAARTQFAGA